ncbi:MAG: transcriptional regulator NrdR [Streptosporangiales bacterium]
MHCPFCRHPDTRVIDSRVGEDGTLVRRRRQCPGCGRRLTTTETATLHVVKRSGTAEPFTRDKVVAGVRKACQGRPVSEDDLARLAQRVEEDSRERGVAELPSHEVGLAVLGPLRELDEVAYLRFASVYRGFESLGDFEREIRVLRAAQEGGDVSSGSSDPGADVPSAVDIEHDFPAQPAGAGAGLSGPAG